MITLGTRPIAGAKRLDSAGRQYLVRSMVGGLARGEDVSVHQRLMATIADRATGWEGDDGE